MCGIAGYLNYNTDSNDGKAIVTKIVSTLSHRGKDCQEVYSSNKISLGHTRLSIIDLSNNGKQPFISKDKRYVLTYNGEIYNYKTLKEELKNQYSFKTKSDTEVVLAAYIVWGKEMLQKLNGMFAFAIWDNIEQKLFVARDRLGIKPVYYYKNDESFLFASEVRSLLSSDIIPRKLNKAVLHEYFKYQTVYAPQTIIKDIFLLESGHYLEIGKDEISSKPFWKLHEYTPNIINSYNQSYKQVCNEVNTLLTNAISRRLVSDVPVASFLSGGIDSSIIVGLMSKLSEKPVQTFSVTFDESEYSEAKYAQKIANQFKTDHNEIRLRPTTFLDDLPNALQAMDHPSGDGINTYTISKVVAEQNIKVALSGLGGDEIFAGYDVFKKALFFQKYKAFWKLPSTVRKSLANTLLRGDSTKAYKIRQILNLETLSPTNTQSVFREVLSDAALNELFNLEKAEYKSNNNNLGSNAVLSEVSIAEISTYMQHVLLRDADQMSMAHTLEVRVPFLDHELVQYVLSLPDKHKIPHSPKRLLTDAVGNLIPNDIINRPKMGFVFPWKHWLKNELNSFAASNINSLCDRSFANADEIKQYWSSFLSSQNEYDWSRIWLLIVLENWLKQNNIDE